MKLYIYDHCPYCVKARMIFGLKNQAVEVVTLLNDDEKTPIGLIGQKMVPILVEEGKKSMPESMDIIHYVDHLSGAPMVKPSRNDPKLNQWLQEVRAYHYPLAMPRWVKMGLDEFATPGAQAYFTIKKEAYIGPFAEHLEKTPEYIQQAHEHLKILEEIIVGDSYFWGEPTEDDFHVFATLRCLTTVKGLKLPEKLNKYMDNMSQLSQVPLHWDKAL